MRFYQHLNNAVKFFFSKVHPLCLSGHTQGTGIPHSSEAKADNQEFLVHFENVSMALF